MFDQGGEARLEDQVRLEASPNSSPSLIDQPRGRGVSLMWNLLCRVHSERVPIVLSPVCNDLLSSHCFECLVKQGIGSIPTTVLSFGEESFDNEFFRQVKPEEDLSTAMVL